MTYKQEAEYYSRKIKRNARKIIVGIIVLAAVLTSAKTVGPEQEGVVITLGKYNRTVQPGLNFIVPFGIERMYKIPVQRQLKQEFGFRTEEPGVRTRYSEEDLKDESLMLTGDLNLGDVEWVVQYRIVDSYQYLFRVRDAEDALHDMSEAAMRKIVGDRTVNEVLTVGRQEVATEVEQLLQRMCDEYENGIRIDQIVLQDVNPPERVKPAFNEVNEARQERETLINRAQADYNRVIPRARGEAREMIQQAEGYAINRVNRATGQASRFSAIFDEYVNAPEVTRTRLYYETLESILPNINQKVIMDENNPNVLPLMNLDGDRITFEREDREDNQ